MSESPSDKEPQENENNSDNEMEEENDHVAPKEEKKENEKGDNSIKSKKRRHSFSFIPCAKKSDRLVRCNSEIFNVKDLEGAEKPKKKGKKCTKSAETLLYEGLHRLATTYPYFIRDISDFVFQNIIGHGGFGEVWLANDLRTGKLVAIKELFAEKLVGRNLTNFIREIVTMGRTKNRFVIPFVGYTVEKPFCIITEYMPNGALSTYLHKEWRAKPIFSGTHLTMIAMGLIVAIRYCHVQRIIHRDIKGANILLDHHFLPKLCDFGISRFIAKRAMTDCIGTASHMAPEIFVSTKYDVKIDVFAYGATLFEMIEKKNPYAGHPVKDVISNFRNGKRPIFRNKEIPEGLKDLVNRCWSQNPKSRPTPAEIYKEFASGKAYFAGTDPKAIKEFAVLLNKMMKEMTFTRTANKKPATKWQKETVKLLQTKLERSIKFDAMKLAFGIELSETQMDDEPLMKIDTEDTDQNDTNSNDENFEKEHGEKAEIISKSSPETNKEPTIIDILNDSEHPMFKSSVIEVLEKVTEEEFPGIYAILIKYFMSKDDDLIPAFILENFTKLIIRLPNIIKFFDQYHFFSILPVNSEQAQRATLFFVAHVFEESPNSIHSTVFRPLNALFRVYPQQTLYLFPHYISRYNRLDNPDPVLILFLKQGKNYINSDFGAVYIRLIYQLYTIEGFCKENKEVLKQTISAFTRSQNTSTMSVSLSLFALTYEETDQIPFDAIIKALPNIQCADSCANILMRAQSYPQSKTLFKSLCDKCQRPKIARCLMKFAAMSNEHRKISASTTKWMNVCNPYTYRTFLIIFADKKLRQNVIKSRHFGQFITKCLRTIPEDVIPSLGAVLRRAELNQGLLSTMTDNSFFEALLEKMSVAPSKQNEKNILGTMIILDSCVQKGYSSDFKLFIHLLTNLIQKSNNLTKPAAMLIVALSSHSKMASRFKKIQGLVDYFSIMKKKGILEEASTIYLNNINSV